MGVVRQDVNRSAGSSGFRGRVSDAEVGQRTIISCTLRRVLAAAVASSESLLGGCCCLLWMLEEDACCC